MHGYRSSVILIFQAAMYLSWTAAGICQLLYWAWQEQNEASLNSLYICLIVDGLRLREGWCHFSIDNYGGNFLQIVLESFILRCSFTTFFNPMDHNIKLAVFFVTSICILCSNWSVGISRSMSSSRFFCFTLYWVACCGCCWVPCCLRWLEKCNSELDFPMIAMVAFNDLVRWSTEVFNSCRENLV